MKLFRCCNEACSVQGDFEAEVAVCPACKSDGRVNADVVIELVPVHYFVKDAAGPIHTPAGNRRIACMPLRERLPKAASGERKAVTCPHCKASAKFVQDEAGEVDQHDNFIEKKMAAEHGLKAVVQGP